jgi:hypothetical protein
LARRRYPSDSSTTILHSILFNRGAGKHNSFDTLETKYLFAWDAPDRVSCYLSKLRQVVDLSRNTSVQEASGLSQSTFGATEDCKMEEFFSNA